MSKGAFHRMVGILAVSAAARERIDISVSGLKR
jgi:hypothetical protein